MATTDNWDVNTGILLPGSWSTSADWSNGSPPTSNQDAYIGTNSGAAIVDTGALNSTVDGVATSAKDLLSINAGYLVATDGTGSNVNAGQITIDNATLVVGAGFLQNSGTIELLANGTTGIAMLAIQTYADLTGSGTLVMDATNGANQPDVLIEGDAPSSVLNNYQTIAGTGTITGLTFSNFGTVESNSTLGPGYIDIVGSQSGQGSFDNEGFVIAGSGGTVELGRSGLSLNSQPYSTTTQNDGLIELLAGSEDAFLVIADNVTIDNGPTGEIRLGGSNPFGDKIVSNGHAATLTLQGGLLDGAGTLGDQNLTLNNVSGTIESDSPAGLVLYTGGNTIDNGGTLESNGEGYLIVESPVVNTGTIEGGFVALEDGATGNGNIAIGANSDVVLGGGTTTNSVTTNSVTFTGASGELALSQGATLSGTVNGAAAGDFFQFVIPYASSEHPVWSEDPSDQFGTLGLYNDGVLLASLTLSGQYSSLDFGILISEDTDTSFIEVQNAPSYPENPGNNDEWILSDGNWAESAGPGSHPAGYNVAGIGDWTGVGTDGILWFDPATGDTDEWQLSNTQWSASVDLGMHPANTTDGNSYQIAGTGSFFAGGIDGVAWTSTNSDGSIATDIWVLGSSGQWINSVSPGNHPAGYAIAGIGDWTGSGTDGLLWFNAATGDTDEWQLSGGKWAASVELGAHPANVTDGLSYQIAGVGDFFDNGIDDVLWTSANANGTIATDIWEFNSSGQWIASVSAGSHPGGYQVAAVGDFTGTGTSDILWYNAATGDADEWLIKNGQWAASIDLGTHPGNFQIAGAGDFNGDSTQDILWHSNT